MGRVVFDDAFAANPRHDVFGVFLLGKTVVDGLEVQKSEPVIMHSAVDVRPGGKTFGCLVPKQAIPDAFGACGMFLEDFRRKPIHAGRNIPFRMRGDGAFDGDHLVQGVVVADSGVGVLVAEG